LSILKIIFSYSILSILLALAVFLLEATGDWLHYILVDCWNICL
jgi:hypothetical protein